jgi:RNA 2',3'-cyclic 3'-phosphodiesterase
VSDERARLFVALALPEPVRRALSEWRAGALAGLGGLRLVAPEDLHVTLCFLGWVAVGEADRIAAACDGALTGRRSCALVVDGAIWLPQRRPRVLAVALEDRCGALAAAQSALSDALATGGWYRPESRPFLAHVTIARVGRGARVRPGERELPQPPGMEFEASRVVLYRSRLSPAGARYEALATCELPGG